VHGNDVVIATHGRAFWVLDDVGSLRQADASEAASGSWLFRPSTAIRMQPAGFTGTPMPKDEPLAPNPPDGAYIDYVVGPAPAGAPGPREITLEILDAKGEVARRYSSADAPPRPDPSKLRTAPEWFNTPSTLTTMPGMHRFVWPLRYPAQASGAGPF